jgi:transposase
MSIYRNDIYRMNDVFMAGSENARLGLRQTLPRIDVREEEYKHQRKASPANTPFPRTQAWAAALPNDIRPTALLRRYARIANLIAATWADAKAFDTYMESLLTDKRGGSRQGFPADVLRELTTLTVHHSETLLRGRP